jgi:hypothetical protein
VTPPIGFVADLKSYDPDLRVRWSDRGDCWLIERKITKARWIDPDAVLVKDWKDYEEYKAAREGYILLMDVDRDCLDRRVFYTLWDSDIWRQGGYEKVNQQINQETHERQFASRPKFVDEVRYEAKQWFRYGNTVRTLSEKDAHTAPPGGMSIVAGNV